ncbi:MAG: mitochondrial 2-enoyl thioester reductase [Thelocarpon superellum]|nr:MAG: mitochondrial 2-enoyl thioester reductase [Thelocarpon superellum]
MIIRSTAPAGSRTLRAVRRLVWDGRRHVSAYGYTQAKALVYSKHGEPRDVLSLHGHSISPAYATQLTLRFLASPINPADVNQIQGVYPNRPPFTSTLGTSQPSAVGGNEGVAEVVSAGSGVKSVSKGDWVVMRRTGFGTWRTHAQADEHDVLKIDDRSHLTPLQAGTVSVNPCTAYRMLRDFVSLRPGDWFMQNGANSGVGRAAIQLGRHWGLRSINVVRDRADEADSARLKGELESLGADVVLTDSELLSPSVRDLLAPHTRNGRDLPRLALNCVGGKAATALAKQLAPGAGAHMVTYGAMAKQPLVLPAGLLIFSDVAFHGFWVSRWSDANPDAKRDTLNEILDLTRRGLFVDTPFQPVQWGWDTPEQDLVQAVQTTLEGYRKGKGVFVFED